MERVLGKGKKERGQKKKKKASRISKLHQRHPIAQGKGTSSILHSHSPVNSQSRLESYFCLYIYHGNEKGGGERWLSNKEKLKMRLP